MTANQMPLPFLARYAVAMPITDRPPVRYDRCRQISQVLVEGHWVDGLSASVPEQSATRMTKITHETTDDA